MHFILFTIFLFTFSNFYFYRRIFLNFIPFSFFKESMFSLISFESLYVLLSDVTEVETCSGCSVNSCLHGPLDLCSYRFPRFPRCSFFASCFFSDFYATDFLMNFLIRKVMMSSSVERLSFLCIWSTSWGADGSVLLTWLWRWAFLSAGCKLQVSGFQVIVLFQCYNKVFFCTNA